VSKDEEKKKKETGKTGEQMRDVADKWGEEKEMKNVEVR